MKFLAHLNNIYKDYKSNKYQAVFELDNADSLSDLNGLKDALLDLKVEKHRKKRWLDANAYRW